MNLRAVYRWTWLARYTWRRTRGQRFPLAGAPDWLLGELASVAGDEQELRRGHEMLMSRVRNEPALIEDEPARIKLAAMKCRAAVLEVPMGTIESFGPFGPQYKVGSSQKTDRKVR